MPRKDFLRAIHLNHRHTILGESCCGPPPPPGVATTHSSLTLVTGCSNRSPYPYEVGNCHKQISSHMHFLAHIAARCLFSHAPASAAYTLVLQLGSDIEGPYSCGTTKCSFYCPIPIYAWIFLADFEVKFQSQYVKNRQRKIPPTKLIFFNLR